MSGKKIIAILGVMGASCGAYSWLAIAPEKKLETQADPFAPAPADSAHQAVAEMAKFLEAAPKKQLGIMIKSSAAAQETGATWEELLPYTKRAANGVWVAQMLASHGPLTTAEEARTKLLESPARALEDVQIVLSEMPEKMGHERGQLLTFVAEIARHIEDHSQVEALLLKEAERPAGKLSDDPMAQVPQAVALNEYYMLVRDPAKQYSAYQAALASQSDPAIKAVLQRFEIQPRETAAPAIAVTPTPTQPAIADAPTPGNPPTPISASEIEAENRDRAPAAADPDPRSANDPTPLESPVDH